MQYNLPIRLSASKAIGDPKAMCKSWKRRRAWPRYNVRRASPLCCSLRRARSAIASKPALALVCSRPAEFHKGCCCAFPCDRASRQTHTAGGSCSPEPRSSRTLRPQVTSFSLSEIPEERASPRRAVIRTNGSRHRDGAKVTRRYHPPRRSRASGCCRRIVSQQLLKSSCAR